MDRSVSTPRYSRPLSTGKLVEVVIFNNFTITRKTIVVHIGFLIILYRVEVVFRSGSLQDRSIQKITFGPYTGHS